MFESLEVFLIKRRQLLDWHLTINVSITRFLPLLSDRYSRFQAVCHRLWTQFVNPNRWTMKRTEKVKEART